MLPAVRRAALGLTTAALAAGTLVATPATAAAARPTARADAAADWLAGELNRNNLVRSGFDPGDGTFVRFTDHGLTLDFYFAFKDLGVKRERREKILDALETRVDDYVAPFGEIFAGSLGKLVTAVQRQRRDLGDYEDGDLLTRLEATVRRGGATEGLAQEAGTTNTIGQSFVVRGLVMANSDLADETATFLLRQQCGRGAFPGAFGPAGRPCGGTGPGSGASVDATSLAIQSLLVADRRDVVPDSPIRRALAAAEAWLLRNQRASGAFRADGAANANSTGLAAAALAALGREGRADRAAEWLRKRQVTRALARDGALGGQRGAVAFDRAAFRDGVEDGIGRNDRDQWMRATAQAAAGLDALRRG